MCHVDIILMFATLRKETGVSKMFKNTFLGSQILKVILMFTTNDNVHKVLFTD